MRDRLRALADAPDCPQLSDLISVLLADTVAAQLEAEYGGDGGFQPAAGTLRAAFARADTRLSVGVALDPRGEANPAQSAVYLWTNGQDKDEGKKNQSEPTAADGLTEAMQPPKKSPPLFVNTTALFDFPAPGGPPIQLG